MRSTHIPHLILFIVLLSTQSGAEQFYYREDSNGVIRFSDEMTDPGSEKTYEPSENSYVIFEKQAEALRKTGKWKINHEKYKDIIHSTARLNDIEPALVEAVILTESAYNPLAISRAGARGLMQLMPKTAKIFGVKDIHDPHDNINGGIKLLRYLIDKYHGNMDLVLAAYNAGETAVEKYRGIPPYAETVDYVAKVRKYYDRFAGQQNYIIAVEPESRDFSADHSSDPTKT